MRNLSFAIMCEGNHLSEWQMRVVNNLLDKENLKLSLIIRNVTPTKPLFERLNGFKAGRFLYTVYNKLLFRPRCNNSVDARTLFADVPTIDCAVMVKGKFSQYFQQADVATIKASGVDFILRFGFNILRGDVLEAARYGVWSFHHDDPLQYRGGPPGFWEIFNGDHANGVILQRLTNTLDSGIVLKKGFFKTCLYSYQKNIDSLYFGSAEWPWLVCQDILAANGAYIDGAPIQSKAPVFLPPSNLQFIIFTWRILGNRIKKAFDHMLMREVWNTGVIDQPLHTCLERDYAPKINFIKEIGPDEFYADPFGYELNGTSYVLQEKYDFKSSNGRIVSGVYPASASHAENDRIIPGPGHQSYPYIFSEGGELFCLPETSQSGRLLLYKLIDSKWVEHIVIDENLPCVDSSVINFNDVFYIFYTRGDKNSDVNLFIKFSPTLTGPWKDHPTNPVKMDIRSARPAGNFFWYNGELYRPSQNCSVSYGGSIVINKVFLLNDTEYREEFVKEIFSWDQKYKDGIHTISNLGNRTLVDVKRVRSR